MVYLIFFIIIMIIPMDLYTCMNDKKNFYFFPRSVYFLYLFIGNLIIMTFVWVYFQ